MWKVQNEQRATLFCAALLISLGGVGCSTTDSETDAELRTTPDQGSLAFQEVGVNDQADELVNESASEESLQEESPFDETSATTEADVANASSINSYPSPFSEDVAATPEAKSDQPVLTSILEPDSGVASHSELSYAYDDHVDQPADSYTATDEGLDHLDRLELTSVGNKTTVKVKTNVNVASAPNYSTAVFADEASVGTYIVRRGDTLSKIAKAIYKNPGRWNELIVETGLDERNTIYPGDVIKYSLEGQEAQTFASSYSAVPRAQWVVKSGETLASIAKSIYGTHRSWRFIHALNAGQISDPNHIEIGLTLQYIEPQNIPKLARHNSDASIEGLP